MKKALLVMSMLLLSAPSFAAQPTQIITVETQGQPVFTLSLDDQPKNSQFTIEGTTVVYDDKTNTSTVKGQVTIEVKQGEKTIWRLLVNDAVVTLKMGAAAPTPPKAN